MSHIQQVRGSGYSLLLDICETAGVQHLVLDANKPKRISSGPPRWSGPGAPALSGEVGGAGLVQPGEEVASGVLTAACPVLQEGYKEG